MRGGVITVLARYRAGVGAICAAQRRAVAEAGQSRQKKSIAAERWCFGGLDVPKCIPSKAAQSRCIDVSGEKIVKLGARRALKKWLFSS